MKNNMYYFVMSTKINNKARQLVSIDRKVGSVTEITVQLVPSPLP